MKNLINVLIIEDHELISDVYVEALRHISSKIVAVNFKTEIVHDCNSALKKLESVSKSFCYDLVFLDISLPGGTEAIKSGEDLGLLIRQKMTHTKIIVITSFSNPQRIGNILQQINPEGLLVKEDLDFPELKYAIQKVLDNQPFFSKTVSKYFKNNFINGDHLDRIDRQLLYELSIGSKMSEITKFIPMSHSGLEKRKAKLMKFFKITSSSNRELILKAKEKGFI